MKSTTKISSKSTKLVVAPKKKSGGVQSCNIAALHCGNCQHHKWLRTFADTCPRVDELLFRGGDKSAMEIMRDTLQHGCPHAIKKGPVITPMVSTTLKPPFPREGLCKECSIEWYVQPDGRVTCYAIMDSGGGYLKKCPVRSCRLMHRIKPGGTMGAIK